MSNSSIMSVREMIDAAFGESDANVVNFKLIQTILYLLARQLRLLERRVGINFGASIVPTISSFSITEVKLQAMVPKKRRKLLKIGGPPGVGKGDRAIQKAPLDKTLLDKSTKPALDKLSLDKVSEPTSSKLTTEKSTADKISSKSTTEKSSSDKTSSKSTTEKSTTDKSSSKSTTDKTSTSTTEKSTTDKTSSKSTTDKTSSKSTTDKTTTSELSSSTKTLTGLSSSDKTKSSSERTKSSTDKSSTDRTKSSTEKSSSTKESSDSTSKSRKKFFSQEYHHLLDLVEQRREQELRVVNQRADSREVAEKTPTPMASLDSMEVQYEKLLIVERVPADEAKKKIGSLAKDKAPRLSIVTQEQFDELSQTVKELQRKFGLVGKPVFPDNIQLMEDLRKGASLTDAMAALQLSARLEAAEKTLNQMTSLITDLAIRKGINIQDIQKMEDNDIETKVIFDAPSGATHVSQKAVKSKQKIQKTYGKTEDSATEDEVLQITYGASALGAEEPLGQEMLDDVPKVTPDCINMAELDDAMQEVYDNLTKAVGKITSKAASNADDALKIARRLEGKLDATIGLDQRMIDVELLVSEYAGQINTLDASLSSRMTNYQEQLTQMQHDLEAGLEAMAEALANPPGDTAGAAELNANFTNLLVEFETTNTRQKDLKERQELLAVDLQALWKAIELLREIKADREEVADALRDKAGLGALNGLVTQQQFDAVRGDFEKQIGASYDKFNNQEIVWQKAIDDLLRELNEKADFVQVVSLRDDINNNIEKLNNKINMMMEIVGEPHSAAISKRLFRDAACLSCSSPAHMNLNEPNLIPALPAFPAPSVRTPAVGAEDSAKPKEDGDHGLCYPGKPIPHPRDPRSHLCHRYCGGSYTTVRTGLSRAPPGMIITAIPDENTGVDSDGKVYTMNVPEQERKPCTPCNFPKEISHPSEAAEAPYGYRFDSDLSPFYVLPPKSSSMEQTADAVSVTPPPPFDD